MFTEKECIVCYETKNFFLNKLVSPCKCDGSIKYIHEYCLFKIHKEKCNVCNTNYNFTWRYNVNTYIYIYTAIFFFNEFFFVYFFYNTIKDSDNYIIRKYNILLSNVISLPLILYSVKNRERESIKQKICATLFRIFFFNTKSNLRYVPVLKIFFLVFLYYQYHKSDLNLYHQ